MKLSKKSMIAVFGLFFLAIFLSASNELHSQFIKGVDVVFGISTINIVGDNPAGSPIFQRDSNKVSALGGGFYMRQPGVSLGLNFNLDEEGDWRMPVTIDYYMFSSLERLPIAKSLSAFVYHEVNVFSFNIGIKYAVLYFPLGNAKIFAGLEAKGNYIGKPVFRKDFDNDYFANQLGMEDETYNFKDAAFRIGGAARISLEGELWNPWMVNASVGIGSLNLLLRDNGRGELLTPDLSWGNNESVMLNVFFSLMLQYKL